MIISLSFNSVNPITLNHAIQYRSAGKFIQAYKSKEYKHMIDLVDAQMLDAKNKIQVDNFNKHYDKEVHYLRCTYRFYYPILTKKGLISMKSKDVSNTIKPIEDAVFKHLVSDDSQIISTNVEKIHSDDIRVEIELVVASLLQLLA